LRNVNLTYEIVLAVGTSSAVAGFSFWQEAAGKTIWAAIGGLTTLLAIVKPVLNFPATLRRKQELLSSYMILDHDLNAIGIAVQQKRKFDKSARNRLARALQRKSELVGKDAESSVNERLRRRCYDEVLRELPSEAFYIPRET
jgi:hypothetical protein